MTGQWNLFIHQALCLLMYVNVYNVFDHLRSSFAGIR